MWKAAQTFRNSVAAHIGGTPLVLVGQHTHGTGFSQWVMASTSGFNITPLGFDPVGNHLVQVTTPPDGQGIIYRGDIDIPTVADNVTRAILGRVLMVDVRRVAKPGQAIQPSAVLYNIHLNWPDVNGIATATYLYQFNDLLTRLRRLIATTMNVIVAGDTNWDGLNRGWGHTNFPVTWISYNTTAVANIPITDTSGYSLKTTDAILLSSPGTVTGPAAPPIAAPAAPPPVVRPPAAAHDSASSLWLHSAPPAVTHPAPGGRWLPPPPPRHVELPLPAAALGQGYSAGIGGGASPGITGHSGFR
jgi:hypothetical protein